MSAEMPAQLRVMGKQVIIKREMAKGDKDYGECRHAECELLVSKKQAVAQERDTLWHELFHFCDEELRTRMKEGQIRRLSTLTLAVLRDNPDLIAYLLAD